MVAKEVEKPPCFDRKQCECYNLLILTLLQLVDTLLINVKCQRLCINFHCDCDNLLRVLNKDWWRATLETLTK